MGEKTRSFLKNQSGRFLKGINPEPSQASVQIACLHMHEHIRIPVKQFSKYMYTAPFYLSLQGFLKVSGPL